MDPVTSASRPTRVENMDIQEDASYDEEAWQEVPPVKQNTIRVIRIPKQGETRWNSRYYCA